MTKVAWIQHITETTGLPIPTTKLEVDAWRVAHQQHVRGGCKECLDRRQTITHEQNRKDREDAYRSLGLVKVRGLLGGTYWE